MDKQYDHIESMQISKRPRWTTICMMATAASVPVLAGCGDDEETAPPAEESVPIEQDAATQPETSMNQEPAMEQDPGLQEESEAPMAEQSMSDENMPEDTMDEPVEGTMNPDEDEAGFGEGTDPMPNEENDENSTSN